MSVRCAVLVFFVALSRLAVCVWCVTHIVARPDLKAWAKAPLEHWHPGLAGYRRRLPTSSVGRGTAEFFGRRHGRASPLRKSRTLYSTPRIRQRRTVQEKRRWSSWDSQESRAHSEGEGRPSCVPY
jgi:hypothetical protein